MNMKTDAQCGSSDDASKVSAQYGEWESEITSEVVFAESWAMTSPRVCRKTGRTFFCENRLDGISHLVEITDSGCKDVLPHAYSASSRVYEYGGGAFSILSGGRLIFSNRSDNTVNILDADSATVECLLKSDRLRYASFNVHPGDESWVLAIEEDHESEIPDKVKNYVVAINVETREVKRVVEGADFYKFPSFSHDGKKICWVQWNFPDMPWSCVQLFWADWTNDGTVQNVQLVAGEDRKSVTEPRWGPDGYLYFCQEQTNFRQLFRIKPGDERPTHFLLTGIEDIADVEFGSASMYADARTYAILSKKLMVIAGIRYGSSSIFQVNLETKEITEMLLAVSETAVDGIERVSHTSFLQIGAGSITPQVLRSVDIDEAVATETILRNSTDRILPLSLFREPEHIKVPAKKGPKREIHGFFWRPHNPRFKELVGEKPPLIVQSHGGPTGHYGPGLNLTLQYWISRGYAVFAINYSGSDGHGKEYRDSLNGNWGILDTDDVAECVEYLGGNGFVDKSRVGIRGGSAGGYSVLQALCRYPGIFAGGVSYYGISELKLLLESTHKMESHYLDLLVFTENMTEAEKDKIMHDRSPLYHAGNITAPLLILHGDADNVVPIEQAHTIYDEVKKRGGDAKLVTFVGEGHGFRKGENNIRAQKEEEKWWRKTLVRK